MSGLRTVLGSAGLVAALGVGYGWWCLVAPGEDKRRERVKQTQHTTSLILRPELIEGLPESNPMRMEESRKRNALVMQALKDASETPDNIARGVGGSK
ncbi:ubiquinol-cytochrome-c reductase complex assembly factor 3 isoform X1 [Pempheris klunzingeri]|uniref:ubiquinol-cytochrome-c reductase complex assembly factor 3 isoform X1 n=1 Tax=Pempheris klunzingeri TaxID=3127111 RepID=UPI00397F07E6